MSRKVVGLSTVTTTSSGSYSRKSVRMNTDEVKALQSARVEALVKRQILSLKRVSPVLVTNAKLKTVAKQRPKRFESVSHYLMSEDWGTWDTASPNILLDFYYKIDCLIQYKGYVIGIDITLDDESIPKKRNTMLGMRSLYDQIGIDKAAILVAKQETEINNTLLDTIIRNDKFVTLL